MNSVELSPELLMMIPVIAALLEVLKRIPIVAQVKEWMPFIAIVASIGVVYAQTSELQFMPAVVMGLMASGAYSGVKAISSK